MATPTTARTVQLRAGVTPRIMCIEFLCQASNFTADFLLDRRDARRFQRYDVEVDTGCMVSFWVQTNHVSGEDFVLGLLQVADPADNARITYRGVELSLHTLARFNHRDQAGVVRSVLRHLGLED